MFAHLVPALLALCLLSPSTLMAQRLPLERMNLPPGFSISLFAEVPNARSMAQGNNGVLFVGTRSDGRVFAVQHADGKASRVITLAAGLQMPNGVAVKDGSLYVAEVSRILRFDNIEAALDKPPKPVVVTRNFPNDTHHGWKFIRFGPDGWLYVPVGAPCNICAPAPDRYALISRIRPDGSGYEVVARGVRNSVGFDWNPSNREMWFTDNGRDWLGDDMPSDELNQVTKAGQHFGYPYCHQGDIQDPEFRGRACTEFVAPAVKLGPHVAALGMRFYTGKQFPAEYQGSIFVAEHGSWNRSSKSGYRIKRVIMEQGKAVRQEVFAEGWLSGDNAWGRPVDLEVLPDGSMLVSDDHAGVIYRISYRRP